MHVLLVLWMLARLFASSPAPHPFLQSPGITVTAPSSGAVINGTSVTVVFETQGIRLVPPAVPIEDAGRRPELNRPGEGHVHFILDLQPLVIWDRADPYTFANVPPGEHQLTVELVNNDHSSLSPQVVRVVQFRTTSAAGTTGQAAGATPDAAPSSMPHTMPVSGAAVGGALVLPALLLSLGLVAIGVGLARRRVNRSPGG